MSVPPSTTIPVAIGVAIRVAILSAVLSPCASAQTVFTAPDVSRIEQARVKRIISTLADDDMRGRLAFTDDALRAADYLASEFAAAGLESPEGADGYLQRFSVQTLMPGPASVVVNGEELPPDRLAVRLGELSLAWSKGDVEVLVVGPADDAQQTFMAVSNGNSDALVLFHDAHAETFNALRSVFGRPVRTIVGKSGPNIVIALVNAMPDATYRITASATITEQPLVNVVGTIPGRRSDEYVLFSAHYDHIGIREAVAGDSIANGANDDASGTTAVVMLGRYFAERGTPERTLLFAAFTAEERGGYGSQYYSTQLDPDRIVAMFNIEMIGKPAGEGPNTAWITGFERSSFGLLLQEAVRGTEYEFYPDPYPDQGLFYRSDNATLASLGVPAHSISTTPIDVDQDYHQVTDHVETLDLEHLTNTIRAIAMGAETIVSGAATPTRVDLPDGN